MGRTLWSRSERRVLAVEAAKLRDACGSWGAGLDAFADLVAGRYRVRKEGEGWQRVYGQVRRLYDKATRKTPPLAMALKGGDSPNSTTAAPVHGGIAGRPYADADLRRDTIDRLLGRRTRDEGLILVVDRLHEWEFQAEEHERKGNVEKARQLRAEVARWRRDLSAIYGIPLDSETGTEH